MNKLLTDILILDEIISFKNPSVKISSNIENFFNHLKDVYRKSSIDEKLEKFLEQGIIEFISYSKSKGKIHEYLFKCDYKEKYISVNLKHYNGNKEEIKMLF